MSTRRLTPEQRQHLLDAVAAGEKYVDIAARIGCSVSTVSHRAVRAGLRKKSVEVSRQLANLLPFDDQPWAVDARCAHADPEIFFPPKGGSPRKAQSVCDTCPVTAECLDYALTRDIKTGVWGSKSGAQRRKLARERAA